MLWDFLEHYRCERDEDGAVTARYYSASAFKRDDQVLIQLAPDPLALRPAPLIRQSV